MRRWVQWGAIAPASFVMAISVISGNSAIASSQAKTDLTQPLGTTGSRQAQIFKLAQATETSVLSSIEPEVLAEINRARTNPTGYADSLEKMLQYYDGDILALPGESRLRTREGAQALQEAIAFLRSTQPLAAITVSPGMSRGAQDHVKDTGGAGVVGSTGSDGSSPGDRVNRYGAWQGNLVELLSYGKNSASAVVLLLIVGDGDPNRGFRQELFNPKAQVAGIACGTHSARGSICVIEYASQYIEGEHSKVAAREESEPGAAIASTPAPETGQTAQAKSSAVGEVAANSTSTTGASASSSQMPPSSNALSTLEQEIIAETNRVRANPKAYAAELEALKQYFDGNLLKLPGQTPMETEEGASVVDEAIQVLKATPPLPALNFSAGMSLGAKDHVQDLGPNGKAGHYGSDGSDPFVRISRYGTWKKLAGENISYSPLNTAQWHVMQLIIDDGFPSRGHREAILKPDYQRIGVACGGHTVYDNMCVMTYATEYQEKRE